MEIADIPAGGRLILTFNGFRKEQKSVLYSVEGFLGQVNLLFPDARECSVYGVCILDTAPIAQCSGTPRDDGK